jgi:exosortase A
VMSDDTKSERLIAPDRVSGVQEIGMPSSRVLVAPLAIVGAGLWLYWDVMASLIRDWANDDNYSHGFLIVPVSAYLAWERRDRLVAARRRPSNAGLIIVLGSLGALVAGILGAEFFLSRVSMIGVLVGATLFTLGWDHLRILAFPYAFLILMIPIPAIVFNQIAFPLQLFASRFGVSVMELFAVPVLREGNVITLANTKLEVAEACSGIRSLISLLTLGIVYGYFSDSRAWVRLLIAASAVPIAIFANGLRVAGTGVLAHYYGPEAALGFFHTFSGWLVFLLAFVLLCVAMWGIRRLFPGASTPLPELQPTV